MRELLPVLGPLEIALGLITPENGPQHLFFPLGRTSLDPRSLPPLVEYIQAFENLDRWRLQVHSIEVKNSRSSSDELLEQAPVLCSTNLEPSGYRTI